MSEALKIVVPTDFSDASLAVLDWVERLNERGHAEVHFINVVQPPVVYMPMMSGTAAGPMPEISDLEKLASQSLDTFIDKHVTGLETPPVKTVRVGRPAEEITDYASKIDAQMIVIATTGQSGITRMMLGSVAEGVVRQAKCAVLTVHG